MQERVIQVKIEVSDDGGHCGYCKLRGGRNDNLCLMTGRYLHFDRAEKAYWREAVCKAAEAKE
jgi:putative hemolysin